MKTLYKLFLIYTVLLGLGLHSAVNAADDFITVRVASYNVKFGKRATPEKIGEMFKPYNLDLIGFNEAPDGDWTNRVGKVLNMQYSYIGKISSANHKNKFKTILSKTPLENTKEYRLQVNRGWNPASAVRAVTRINGIPIAFYSLHICASGKVGGHAYRLATKVLLKEKNDRVIVVGDFNNKIGDPAMTTIEESGMRPTWKDLKIDLSQYSTSTGCKSKKNPGVIDHILYNISSKGHAADGGIIELEKPLSDHKPVWAEIVFPLEIKKVKKP